MSTAKRFAKRVFRHTNHDSAPYYVRLMFQGDRGTFNTRSTVRSEAAIKAREIFVYLRANGWDATLAKYSDKPGPVTTLGEFTARVQETFVDGQKRTIVDYVSNLRKVAGEIAGLRRSAKKYDYRSPAARQAWLAKVNRLPLESITREKVEAWRAAYVAAAGNDLNRIRARKTSCNSILRQARALFKPESLERAGLSEISNPFEKIKPFPAADMRYRGGLDAQKIFKDALRELATDPEALKALLLCLCAGLRRNEADKIYWNAVDWEAGVIRIALTSVLHVKGKKIGEVSLEPEIMALFRGWYAKRTGKFVLESEIEARPGSNYAHYRAQKTFDRLTAWLRVQGFTSRNPVHELRKLFGSLVYLRFDLLAASEALRHSHVGTTAAHYVVKRPRVTVGFGALVESENVIPLPKADDQTNQKSLNLGAKNA